MSKTKQPAPAPKKPLRVTAPLIGTYLSLQDERRELARKVSALERREKPIQQALIAHIQAEGGKARTCTKGKYTLSLEDAPGSVSWKAEYVKLKGAEAAEKLQAKAPLRAALVIA